MVGSFHTDLAAYTSLLSGSRRLGALMREYMRWPYGRCRRILAPSHHTRELFIQAKGDPKKVEVWPRGVDTTLFSPEKRSAQLRADWHVADNRPALLYVGRVSRERGLDMLPALSRRLHTLHFEHRFIIAGDGPMIQELKRDTGATGLVCHSDNPTQWARLIVDLLRDRARHAAMVKGARDYALTRRWPEALQPLYRAYREVAAAPATAAPRDVLLRTTCR